MKMPSGKRRLRADAYWIDDRLCYWCIWDYVSYTDYRRVLVLGEERMIAMGETLEEIKRFIFEVALSPEELERLTTIQEAISARRF